MFPIRLFERVPASFFSVLASPNREIYWVALVTLHNMLQYSLEIPLEDYRTALGDQLADMELAAEADGEEGDQELLRQPNGKIRWIINRLIRSGWLDREYREGSFEEVIAPRDHADRMIRLLLSIEKLEDREYNSLVYATYSSLKQAYVERSDHIYDALASAKRNTQELLNDLKSLFHNIRFYHQSIGQALDVNQLLRDYYDDYKKLLDRIYHPIKTMDSLSIYRDPIIDILNGLQYDDELLEMAATRMCTAREDLTPEAASDALLADINFLLASYGSLDGLVQEIDRKHRAYTRESVDSIRYRMSADHSIKGKLVGLLNAYANATAGKEQANCLQILQSGIQCENQAYADTASLWHPTVRTRRPDTPSLPVEDLPPETEQDLLAGLKKDLQNQYSITRARAYILHALGDRSSVTSDELELNADAHFILLLIATVRSTDQATPFAVEFLDGRTEKNGYSVPRMRFVKK